MTCDTKPLKTIRSYTGHAQWLADAGDPIGTIARQPQIPSPYRYSQDHCVYRWRDRAVFLVETAHRCYQIFAVPDGVAVDARRADV